MGNITFPKVKPHYDLSDNLNKEIKNKPIYQNKLFENLENSLAIRVIDYDEYTKDFNNKFGRINFLKKNIKETISIIKENGYENIVVIDIKERKIGMLKDYQREVIILVDGDRIVQNPYYN